jgi:hypothetical protein
LDPTGKDANNNGFFDFWKQEAPKPKKGQSKEDIPIKKTEAYIRYSQNESEYKQLSREAYKSVRNYIKRIGEAYLNDPFYSLKGISDDERDWVRPALNALPDRPQTFQRSWQHLKRKRWKSKEYFAEFDNALTRVITYIPRKILRR